MNCPECESFEVRVVGSNTLDALLGNAESQTRYECINCGNEWWEYD